MGDSTTLDTEDFVVTAFLETMGTGNTGAVEEYFADTLDYYRSSGELVGQRELVDDIEMFHTAFPDLSATIRRSMSQDGSVSLVYSLSGTHEGRFEGIPPTRQEMETKGAAISQCEDGRITEYRIVFDNLGMLKQLGVIAE